MTEIAPTCSERLASATKFPTRPEQEPLEVSMIQTMTLTENRNAYVTAVSFLSWDEFQMFMRAIGGGATGKANLPAAVRRTVDLLEASA